MYAGKFKPNPIDTEYGHFDSKSEFNRYLELLEMERLGVISDLQRQVTFELLPKQYKAAYIRMKTKTKRVQKMVEREMTYTCDFVYKNDKGKRVVEDHKGSKYCVDEAMRIKKKLLYYFHKIELVFSFPPPKEKKTKKEKGV